LSAKHALLGLLLHRPAYRYQLGDRLQKLLGPAWKINPGQLYRSIERLKQDGLIERIDNATDDEDERHVFAITDNGAEEFERWFEESTNEARLLRRPLLVKITLAGPQRLESALKQIASYEQTCAARVEELTREQQQIPAGGRQVLADDELLRFALSGDIAFVEGELRWARYMHERVAWLKNQDVVWPATYEHPGAGDRARDRQIAHKELFGRIAGRQAQTTPERPAQDCDDEPASAEIL
jgi:DNA-binding PadR family transcriptional regulator